MVHACGAVWHLVVSPHGEPGPMPVVRLLLTALIVLLPFAVSSQPAPSQAEWIEALRQGGYVIVFRHGATTDQTNTDSMSRSNVAGERQLNEQGRAQVRSIGQSMRKLKIPVGLVLTSTTQRAVDTGKLLGFGEVTPILGLTESGPALAPDENNRRAEALRKLVAGRPPADSNLVIVSHKPNIIDAFGKGLAGHPRRRGVGVRTGRQWRIQNDRPHRGGRVEQAGPGVELKPARHHAGSFDGGVGRALVFRY
jgi:phosphohistidine phosphatase SixA